MKLSIVFATLAVALCGATPAVDARQTVSTVHVSTELHPSGLQDSATTDRQKAVEAIKKRLRSQKNIRLVADQGHATIIIVVTSVISEPVWRPTMYAEAKPLNPGEPLPEGTRPAMVARAILTRGSFKTSFAEAEGAFRTSVTDNLARSIEEWFRANAKTLTGLVGI